VHYTKFIEFILKYPLGIRSRIRMDNK